MRLFRRAPREQSVGISHKRWLRGTLLAIAVWLVGWFDVLAYQNGWHV